MALTETDELWLQKWFKVLSAQLTAIAAKLDTLIAGEKTEMATLQDIVADVSNQTTVIGSVTTLLQQLTQQLQAAIANEDDPSVLQSLADQLSANTTALANAVAANTPAAPAAPAAPPATPAPAPAE